MSDVLADRREAPRFALTLVAEVTELVNSTVLTARSSDVSRSGCYIDTLNPMPPGTQVNVRLRSEGEAFETAARVVYICPGLGMGVTWGMNPAEWQLATLDRWLQKAARSLR
jgi:hypothetical protein